MKSPLTTLCYIEHDGCYLMMHRVRKKNDENQDKWIGIGGHFEEGESPEECLLREAKEETGLTLRSFRFRGLVTFVSDLWGTEYMCLYTAELPEDEADAAGKIPGRKQPAGRNLETAAEEERKSSEKNLETAAEEERKSRERNLETAAEEEKKFAERILEAKAQETQESSRIVTDEGILEWVPKSEIETLNIWEGDRIFLRLLAGDAPFFSLKLRYEGDALREAVLDGISLDPVLGGQ